jgi:hypothetical protein
VIEPPLFDTNLDGTVPGDGRAAQAGQGGKLVRILVLIGALAIAAVGLLASGAGILISLLDSAGNTLEMATASASFLALTVGLGLAVAWQAGQAIAGRPSGRFRPRRIGAGVLLFVAALILGQLVRSLDLVQPLIFPLFHIAAATLPPLIILAAVGRGLQGAGRWRDVVLETGSGAMLSTLLAFSLEFAVIVGGLAIGLVFVAMQPGGVELLQTVANRFQDPATLQDAANLTPLVRSPLVVAAILIFVSGIIPLIEEAVKTIGVGLLAYRRPTLPEAVVWGVASGAGFALAEGMFNSIGGLEAWAGVALLRVGASLLHCFTGGLMGVAWYYLVVERRPARTLGLFAGSVAIHSLWNALVTGISLLSLLAVGGEITSTAQGAAGLGSLTLLALLCLLALSTILGLVVLARYTRRHSPVPHTAAVPPAVFQAAAWDAAAWDAGASHTADPSATGAAEEQP